MKRIVICSDGTWNKPEDNLEEDIPTNVLKFSRAIKPLDDNGVAQIVFYDWGIGSYHDSFKGGAFGAGLDKNIMDAYRFIVHNYEEGDEIFLFGFSRGAYTIRSLAGFMNNCSVLEKKHANRIIEAYDLYKNPKEKPSGEYSVNYRKLYSVSDKVPIHFVGAWDTVGSLGLPTSIFGFIKEKHLFYDQKIGSIIKTARHALSIDELRKDFKPTIWEQDSENLVDLKQVWFSGVHSDVGGSYPPDGNGFTLSDIPMLWMKEQAEIKNLQFQPHISEVKINPFAEKNNEFKKHYKLLGKLSRKINSDNYLHTSVKQRFENNLESMPDNLKKFVSDFGWRIYNE